MMPGHDLSSASSNPTHLDSASEDVSKIKPLGAAKRTDTWLDTPAFIDDFVELNYSREHYQALAERAKNLLEAALKDVRDRDEVEVQFRITCRAKATKSLADKLKVRDKTQKYKTVRDILEDVKDLAGVRVVLYTPNKAQRLRVKQAIVDIWGEEDVEEVAHGNPGASRAANPIPRNDDDDDDDDENDVGDDMTTAQGNDYVPQHLGYQAKHYRTLMLEGQGDDSYTWKRLDRVEIQVVSALGHAWAEASHDVMYKTGAYGRPTIMEHRILDALNGLLISGDLLLEQFRDAVTKRTYAKWEHPEQLSMFLRESDILNFKKKMNGNIVRISFEDHFAHDTRDVLHRFLQETGNNYPLAVRNALSKLGYPDESASGLKNELLRVDPQFEPPHGLCAPFCIFSHLSRQIPLKPDGHDILKKCSIMMDALILLQVFLGRPEAANEYLLHKATWTEEEKESLDFVLADPHRRDCFMKVDGNSGFDPKEELEPAWDWFTKQAREGRPCGVFFRMALAGIPWKRLEFPERMKVLEIKSLSRANTLQEENIHTLEQA